tara:strand:- start:272 stop:610 length:339 start_codon:yes stop_codon:yes gene_type:complete
MSLSINGVITKILPVESGISKGGKEWNKQTIIVEQDGTEYNKELAVSFFGDKMKSIRDKTEGSEVSVSFNLSSREFNGKWYNQVDGWWCAEKNKPMPQDHNEQEQEDKDLPF